jgi:hypothetical protein
MENTNDPTQITIADLDTLKNIVDLACTRGAFRGAELTQVGAIYDKLTQFLDAIIAQAKAQEEANQSAKLSDNQSQGE